MGAVEESHSGEKITKSKAVRSVISSKTEQNSEELYRCPYPDSLGGTMDPSFTVTLQKWYPDRYYVLKMMADGEIFLWL